MLRHITPRNDHITIMYTGLIILHIVVSLLLVGAVLIQSGRGAASSNIFGGGAWSTENVFGAATPAILNRITTVLAAAFIVTSLTLTILGGKQQRSVIKRLGTQQVVPLQKFPFQQPSVPQPAEQPE